MSGSEPVPYATIGIKGKNIGTVADESGHFKMALKVDDFSPEKDKIIISCIGYADKMLDLNVIKANGDNQIIVSLPKTEIALNEVAITGGKIKEIKFGKTSKSMLTSITIFSQGEDVSDALGREIGMILKINSSVKLKDFNMYVAASQFKLVKFRLQFYDLTGNEPALIPMSKDVIFDVDVPKGWIKVDLNPYNIFIEGKDKIGVTMQWIKSVPLNEKSRYFVISSGAPLGSKGLYRPKSKAPWVFPKYNLSLYLTADSY